MFPIALSFIGACAAALVLTYVVRGFAVRGGWVDVPDGDRRCHEQAVPRLGGVAIYLSFALVWFFLFAIFPHVRLAPGDPASLLALIVGGTAIFGIGLWDDIRGLSAEVKLALQIAVAVGVCFAGVRIEGVGLLTGSEAGLPYWGSLSLTTVWIVGITNAFNLIDGSDGIAGGAALFASASMAVVLLLFGNLEGAVVALGLAGAILGFLFFNFPPASIFLGDSGSLFIGFMLATVGVLTTQTASTTLAVVIPVVACGLPILDTSLAMVRRFLRREHIFRADRGHIHHRLRDLGHSPRKVAFLLYASCAGFALASLLLVNPSTRALPTIILLVSGAVVWMFVQRLRIPELLEFKRIVHRGFQQRSVIAHNMRIRDAVSRIRAARDLDSVIAPLAKAFSSGEFQKVELWVRASSMPQVDGANGFVPCRAGYRWTWLGTETQPLADLWELQLPFRSPKGRVIGRLSVWGFVGSEHLLTDIRLLALELQPEFHEALRRMAKISPPQPAIPSLPQSDRQVAGVAGSV